MARGGLVPRLLTAQPQQLVDLRRARPALNAGAPGPRGDNQLDGVQCAGAKLDFLRAAVLDQLAPVDPGDQSRVQAQDSVETEHVRDQIVSEHRQPAQIVWLDHARSGQIRGRDLGAFEEGDIDVVVARAVGKAGPGPEAPRQRDDRSGGGRGQGLKPSAAFITHVPAEVPQRSGEQCHQLMSGILTERLGYLSGLDVGERSGAPASVPGEALADARGDGEVARVPGALVQGGKPPGAEVDRVKREPERRSLLG